MAVVRGVVLVFPAFDCRGDTQWNIERSISLDDHGLSLVDALCPAAVGLFGGRYSAGVRSVGMISAVRITGRDFAN